MGWIIKDDGDSYDAVCLMVYYRDQDKDEWKAEASELCLIDAAYAKNVEVLVIPPGPVPWVNEKELLTRRLKTKMKAAKAALSA